MKQELCEKIRHHFSSMSIYKDPEETNSLFSGRNLPSFVKDFLLKRYVDFEGRVNKQGLTSFLDMVIPKDPAQQHSCIAESKFCKPLVLNVHNTPAVVLRRNENAIGMILRI